MKIRPYVQNDEERVMDILERRDVFNPVEIEVAREVLQASLAPREEVEYHAFCAVDENEDVRGYVCFGPIPMADGCYDLYWIAVDREFAGRGIGGRLMRFAEEFAEGEGVRRIYVDTSSTPGYQAARALYNKHGYRRVCCLSDFYRLGDDKYIFMKEIGKEERQVP